MALARGEQREQVESPAAVLPPPSCLLLGRPCQPCCCWSVQLGCCCVPVLLLRCCAAGVVLNCWRMVPYPAAPLPSLLAAPLQVLLQGGDLLLLVGEARYQWQHGIAPVHRVSRGGCVW